MKRIKVKICGLMSPEDSCLVNRYCPDYIGIVMFYSKSHRSRTPKQAEEILSALSPDIQTVAVVVSPSVEQVQQIAALRFDYIQIHGELSQEVYDSIPAELSVIRAIAMREETDCQEVWHWHSKEKIKGFLFDAPEPGSGKSFDWESLGRFCREHRQQQLLSKPVFLAGGLNAGNVIRAITAVKPDAVDISSGVEKQDKSGKEESKLKEFIETVAGTYCNSKTSIKKVLDI